MRIKYTSLFVQFVIKVLIKLLEKTTVFAQVGLSYTIWYQAVHFCAVKGNEGKHVVT